MAASQQPVVGADAVYKSGLETLVSQSPTIVAGFVSNYSKRVLKESEPGPNAIPLKWVVKGTIDHPRVLKGSLTPIPIAFTRTEQSMMIPRDPSTPEWEIQYGDLQPSHEAVLFLQGDAPAPIVKILPDGTEQQGLVSLVADILKIQTLDKGPQETAWLRLVAEGASADKVEIAMRSLLAGGVTWQKLYPSLSQFMRSDSDSDDARAFAFGIVAYWLTQSKWGSDSNKVSAFLCQTFTAERKDDLAIQYVLHLKQILRYTEVEKFRKDRAPLREEVLHCLRNTPAQGPEVEQQYKDILHSR